LKIRYKKDQGFILISVLTFLMVMTALTFASFQYAKLTLLTADAYRQSLQVHNHLIATLNTLPKAVLFLNSPCRVKSGDASQYLHKNYREWQSSGCLVSKEPFITFMVYELKDDGFCMRVNHTDMRKVLIKRLTIVSFLKNHESKFIVQATQVNVVDTKEVCQATLSLVETGLQGFRFSN
jgi:hypothetical protein